MEIKFEFEWKEVEVSKGAKYNYPEKMSTYMKTEYGFSSVYRWVLRKGDDLKLYIGEADQLCPQRINGYINLGPKQFTNIRMKEKLLNFKEKHYDVTLEFLSIKSLLIENKEIHSKDLANKYLRKFIEHLLLWHYSNDKRIELLNR